MSHRSAAFLLLVLALTPSVLAHGGVEDEDRYYANQPGADESVRPPPAIPEGYTGPAREPYMSFFEGSWIYGQVTATPFNSQFPDSLDVDGDWVVWEDTNRSDIYAYNVPAGQGFYVTSDRYPQHHPKISNGVVVFEDYRHLNRASIYAYFLETGEVRRLSTRTTALRDADIDYPIVAWLDENITNPDVWAYSLLNNTEWNLHASTDRDSAPVVVKDKVYWRTYRYNLWDIVGYDTTTGQGFEVTTDAAIQSAPFSNGEDLFFLSNVYELGWEVYRYDVEDGLPRRTPITLPDASHNSASGDGLLRVALDLDYQELVIRNLTSGTATHVSANILLASDPVLQDKTIFAMIRTRIGVSLVMIDVSPFAFAKAPSLTITNPPQNTAWLRPLVVTGLLQAGPEFSEPTTFTYRIDNEPPQIIAPGRTWRITLDPAQPVTGGEALGPGRHVIDVRATFREGPPVEASLVLIIPAPAPGIDVERAGPAFHAARVMARVNGYFVDNPAVWILIPLVLLILVLVGIRIWLWLKPRRRRSVVEFVQPDDA